MNASKPTVHVNGIDYRWPLRPVVVVCIDGGDPAYLQQFLSEGIIPNIARILPSKTTEITAFTQKLTLVGSFRKDSEK